MTPLPSPMRTSHLEAPLPLARPPQGGEHHVVLHDGVLGGLVHVEVGKLAAQLLQFRELPGGVTPDNSSFMNPLTQFLVAEA